MQKKLYMLLKNIYLITKYLLIFIRLFFIKLRIKFVKYNWHPTESGDYYNPKIPAVVYKYRSTWKIARYSGFFGDFENKNDAMASILQEWIEENNILDTISSHKATLKNIKQEIFSSFKTTKNYLGKIKLIKK